MKLQQVKVGVRVFSRTFVRLRRGSPPRLNVFGVCPQTHARVPTHAYMTEPELERFNRSLALFCPACRRAHQFTRADLSLNPHAPAKA